jgi:hypothetical protein
MKLSTNFTKEELIYSDTAKALNIKNEPNEIQHKVLVHTCEYFLEPLRKQLNEHYKTFEGKQVKNVIIKITSGFRCLQLNRKIGSSDTSQHTKGEAIDFDAIVVFKNGKRKVIPYTETYEFIKQKVKQGKLSVDQLICESSGGAFWVHASYKAAGATVNRKQFLIYTNGRYIVDTK